MINVTAAIILKNQKVLIAKRKNNGKWEFPGGKAENNETFEDCLVRELKEELGINTKVLKYLCSNEHKYEHIHIKLFAYLSEHLSGEFTLKDHTEIKWVYPDELKNNDLSEADIPIAEYVNHFLAKKHR